MSRIPRYQRDRILTDSRIGTPDELLAKTTKKGGEGEAEEGEDKAWFKEMWDNAH